MNKDESTTTTISTILSNRVKYDDGALVAIKIDVEGAELKALQGALPLLRKLWLQQEIKRSSVSLLLGLVNSSKQIGQDV